MVNGSDAEHSLDDSESAPPNTGGFGRRILLNAAQLGGSLAMAWTMSLVGRFILPRVLGTEKFGELALMESVATLALSLMAFGVHEYIGKEVAVDHAAAARFAKPLFRLQLTSGIGLAVATGLVVLVTSGAELALVVSIFALAQINVVLGKVFAAYLQARHEAGVVSLSAVVTKAVWLTLLLALLGVGAELLALPVALVVSELVRTVWLARGFRDSFGPPEDAPMSAATTVLRRSVPHYINALNVDVMGYSVPILVGLLGGVAAAGIFSAALLAASVPMLLTPVLGWIAIPVLSNLREEGADAMWARVGSITDSLAPVVMAGGIALFALSDEILPLLFGNDFRPSGPAFAWIALTVPATYFTQLVGSAFIADDRSWQNTKVNLYTLIFVVVGMVIVLLADGSDDPGRLALLTAAVATAGEWITVIALLVLRPYRAVTSATVVRFMVLAVAGGIATMEKLGDDRTDLRLLAAGIAVMVAVSDLPRLLATVRRLLADR